MIQGLNNEEIEDRFFVRGRMEVLNVLHDLIYRCEPVTVVFNNGTDNLTTTLLEAKDAVLIFELSQDAQANQRLSICDTCVFIAYPDGILVQFSCSHINQISWGDSDAFAVSVPERVARLQRQQSFRIQIASKSKWMAALFSDTGADLGKWPLHNLSVGGIGVTVGAQWQLAAGQTIVRASFALPDFGAIDCAVALRHETGLADDDHDAANRIGLEFVQLPPEMGAALQRYIINTEHERRSADENGYDATLE